MGYDHVLGQIETMVNYLAGEAGARPVNLGIGTPGTLDRETGLLRGSNSRHLNGKPVDRDLEKLLDLPVRIENDANCFALAETMLGSVAVADPAARVVFGVIMGTGVGGGLVIDGKIVTGKHGIAGEWGHNFLDKSGGDCYCGKTGCVETVISGPALENHYKNLADEDKTLAEIAALADQNDENAVIVMNRLYSGFGKAIATLVNIIDPDVIVIGGGVGNIDGLYSRGVKEVEKHIFAPALHTRIIKPVLGDSAGVFGAAWLWRS
jgi:predicted NBD/HSP70 family sugar kinase